MNDSIETSEREAREPDLTAGVSNMVGGDKATPDSAPASVDSMMRDGAEPVAVEAFIFGLCGGKLADLYKLPNRCKARAEVERLAAQSAPVLVDKNVCGSDVDGNAAQSAPLAQQAAREYPPLPEWAKRDDLGGLVPSEIRAALRAYVDADRAAAQVEPSAPPAPGGDVLEKAYELGFLEAAQWASRDDLRHDITSPAYLTQRDHDLAALATQAQGQDAAPAEQDTGDCGFSACITCAQARAKE